MRGLPVCRRWFVELLLTELVIALVVRTSRPFWKSTPGKLLWVATLAVAIFTILLPYLPVEIQLGYTPLPDWLMATLVGMTNMYVVAVEIAKKYFYQHNML